ncbi:hypothetical protein PFISCL1PPCAC_23378, partial [Pristionchus fissidentatus]
FPHSGLSICGMRALPLLLVFCAVSRAADWKCGATKEQLDWTRSAIDGMCPTKKDEINNCCIEHDACYKKKTGREPCDETFATCVTKAVERTNCVMLAVGMAYAVRLGGQPSYN